MHVDDTVFEPLACADAALRSDERELGVCLADLGAGSTGLIVFHEGAVAHTAVLPIGGDHFTSDLSVGLCTPVAEAEKIKRLYGNAIVTLIPEGNEVEVPSVGDRASRLISQRMVAEILEPRARELFEMLRDNLRHAGMFELCAAGVVLTGGGCRLPGIIDVAESVLRPAAATGMAGAIGEDAVNAGRTRVCNGPGHGLLRTSSTHRPRYSGRPMEFEIESNVCGKGCINVVPPFRRDAGATIEIREEAGNGQNQASKFN